MEIHLYKIRTTYSRYRFCFIQKSEKNAAFYGNDTVYRYVHPINAPPCKDGDTECEKLLLCKQLHLICLSLWRKTHSPPVPCIYCSESQGGGGAAMDTSRRQGGLPIPAGTQAIRRTDGTGTIFGGRGSGSLPMRGRYRLGKRARTATVCLLVVLCLMAAVIPVFRQAGTTGGHTPPFITPETLVRFRKKNACAFSNWVRSKECESISL